MHYGIRQLFVFESRIVIELNTFRERMRAYLFVLCMYASVEELNRRQCTAQTLLNELVPCDMIHTLTGWLFAV